MRLLRTGAGALLIMGMLTAMGAAPAQAATLPAGTGPLDAITCSGATCVAVGSSTGVYSSDGGSTWSAASIDAGDWTAVTCASTTTCYAAGSDTGFANGLITATTDGGKSWTQAYSVPGELTGVSCAGGHCIAVGQGPSGNSLAAAASAGGAWSALPAPAATLGLWSVGCVDAAHCWAGVHIAGGSFAVEATSNGGQTWAQQTLAPFSGQPAQQEQPNSIDFLDATHGFLTLVSGGCGGPGLIGCGGGIETTSDGGAHWALVEQINNGPTERAISCSDVLHCEVVGGEVAGGVIQVTADGGAHWAQQGSTSGSQVYAAIDCINASTCLIAGGAKTGNTGQITANPGPGGGTTPPPPPPGCTAGPRSPAPTGVVSRLAGADRDATSVAVSMATFPSAGTAGAVVLASDANYPDALAGTPLAALKHAPLLLTTSSGLAAAVAAEISRVAPKGSTVYILGGAAALSSAVDGQVQGLGDTPQRIAGANRFGTAVAIAGVMGNPSKVLEATGVNFPDALSAGAAAAKIGGAVLLTNGSAQAAETAAYLAAHGSDSRTTVGGPAASADPTATPLAGADRYATAVDVAQTFFTSPSQLGFASGVAFPDALSGGANMGAAKGPMLLVPACGSLPSSLSGYLAAGKSSVVAGRLFGGTSAVGDDVLASLEAAA